MCEPCTLVCVCVRPFVCAPMISYAILLNLPPSLRQHHSLSVPVTHTHTNTQIHIHSHTRASLEGAGLWQVQAFWSRAILLSFPPALQLRAASWLLGAKWWGRSGTSICLVNTEIRAALPSWRQKIAVGWWQWGLQTSQVKTLTGRF